MPGRQAATVPTCPARLGAELPGGGASRRGRLRKPANLLDPLAERRGVEAEPDEGLADLLDAFGGAAAPRPRGYAPESMPA